MEGMIDKFPVGRESECLLKVWIFTAKVTSLLILWFGSNVSSVESLMQS